MKEYYSVGEAAKEAGTTSETLRHYDRIGLVKPSKKDEWTKYRYYTKQDIVRINTVRALQQMDLPLQEIKEVLEYDDLRKIVDYLKRAEDKADEKIEALKYGKAKIISAKADYEKKLRERSEREDMYIKEIPRRTIMMSYLERPTLDNLWNYHRHFYDNIDESLKDRFSFEDTAGVYTENGRSQMFAVCSRFAKADGLKTLPGGKYLCADCTEETRESRIAELIRIANDEYGVQPNFILQMIVISGVLKWKYQLQVLIDTL